MTYSVRRTWGWAVSTYGRHLGRVVGLALVVLGPFVVVQSLLGDVAEEIDSDALSVVLVVALSLLVSGGSGFSSCFFAGVLDHTVEAHRTDGVPQSIGDVARVLPYGRLLLASLLVFLATAAGFVACVLPGFVLMVLLAPVGPLVSMEDLRPVTALRRSAALVRPHFGGMVLTLVPLILAEGLIHSVLELLPGGHQPVGELVIQVVVTAFVGSFVGLVEVHATHELLAVEHADAATRPPGHR